MNLKDLPIERKFLFASLLLTLSALILSSGFLIANEWRSFRRARLEEARTIAGIIAANSAAALVFDDPETAEQILAGIRARPDAIAAALYKLDGSLYQRFPTNLLSSALPARPKRAHVELAGRDLHVFEDVVNNGRRVGSAYIRFDVSSAYPRFFSYLVMVAGVVASCIAVGLLMSRLLQRWISRPIISLSKTAQAIAERGNYSLRAAKFGADEVGNLVDAFNRMVAEVQAAQQRLQLALTAGRMGAWEWDITENRIAWSPTLEEIHGLKPATFGGRLEDFKQTVHPNDLETVLAQIQRTVEQRGDHHMVYRIKRTDGSVRWLEAFGGFVPDADDQPQHLAGVCMDITERKQAEETLRESEHRFRILADSAPVLIWINGPEGCEFVNRQYLEFLGVKVADVRGYDWARFIHPEDREGYVNAYVDAMKQHALFEAEFRFRREDGEYRWMRSVGQPRFGPNDEFLGYAGLTVDISENMKARETLKQRGKELELAVAARTGELRATNEQLEAFVYSIAHDLRAPLRSVTGYSQLLLEDHATSFDETAQQMLKRIQGSSEFMDKLLLDLLAYGRTARAEIELGPVPVQRAWEAALFQCAAQSEQTDAQIETSEPLPIVRAHEATLGQVLANLLSNALKFVEPEAQPRVRFWAEDRGDCVRLWMADNGIGIPAEQHERVFRVFERLQGSHYAGTGIGLSIVRKGIERMGGQAGLESEPGQGSRFWIELPKAD